jgi:hypothetical protein
MLQTWIIIASLLCYPIPVSDAVFNEDSVTNRFLECFLFIKGSNILFAISMFQLIIKARKMKWAGHVARMGEKRNVYRMLVGKPERRRPLGKPRRRWLDNIRMGLVEVGWGDVDWIGLA